MILIFYTKSIMLPEDSVTQRNLNIYIPRQRFAIVDGCLVFN